MLGCEVVRERVKPIGRVAEGLGVSVSGLRRWMARAEIDDGTREGLTTTELEGLRRLCRESRVLKMECDLVSRAAALFASENVGPK